MNKQWPHLFSFALILALLVSLAPAFSSPAHAVSTGVVISQLYGGGGNTGAQYKNDFIELYNLGTTPVNINGWTVQYASTTGSSWSKTVLSGTIQPGHYYLVQESVGTSCGGSPCGIYLPTPDAVGGIFMSATGGKVALVNNSTTLTGTCPAGVVDFVGFDGANCAEGSPTPALSNTKAAIRNGNGSIDTDNNLADFTVAAPNPHNSQFPNPSGYSLTGSSDLLVPDSSVLLLMVVTPGQSPSSGFTVTCDLSTIGGDTAQAFYDDGTHGDVSASDNTFSFNATVATVKGDKIGCTVSDSQGKSGTGAITLNVILPIGVVNGPINDTEDATQHTSPYLGKTVTVQGVIYEKTLQASKTATTYKGFFVQNTSATADADPNTSDGLFIYMGSYSTLIGPGGTYYTPNVGDEVVLSGTISEYYNYTEMTGTKLVLPVQDSVNIEEAVPPVVADPPANLADANRYWERLQSMRVQVPQNSIVLGGRNVFSPADAEVWVAAPDSTVAQRGESYASRAFRDAHPLDDNYSASNWDGNGYRILMGSLGIKATANDAQALITPARTFETVTNAPAGGLNYTYSKYRIEISTQPELAEGLDPTLNNPPAAVDRANGFSIVDYNLENLYDYRNNPFSGCDFAGDPKCSAYGTPFIGDVNPTFDYVPASDAAYQARLTDIATQIINDLHSPDILMVQEVENQDICSVADGDMVCGITDNADGKPDVLQDLALKIASLGGPVYDAAFDRDSSDLRGILPAFLYRTDRVQLLPAAGDPVLGGNPDIAGYTPVPLDGDVSNPKTLNAVLPAGITPCETTWVFPRAPDIALFRIFTTGLGSDNYRDVYVINNHFKSGPDSCVAHRTEQAKYNAAVVAFLEAANPEAHIVLGGDLNVYPRPDDPFAPIGTPSASDQLGSLYDPALGLKNLWEVLLGQAPEAAYSYVYLGMAQTLDQMFVNGPMLADLQQFRISHINSDFAADDPVDIARGTSDHDPNVANFLFSAPPVVAAPTVSPEPSTEGSPVIASATFTDPDGSQDGPFVCAVDYGDGSGLTPGLVDGSSCTGPQHAYTTYGTYTVTVSVMDKFNAMGSNTASHTVVFNWSGFFAPVDNLPVVNLVKAGQAIPLKFSLGGDKGLAILADGYPVSEPVACGTDESLGEIEGIDTAGSSSLAYDPLTNSYILVWKTDDTWSDSCRRLTLKLVDGTTVQLDFKFKK